MGGDVSVEFEENLHPQLMFATDRDMVISELKQTIADKTPGMATTEIRIFDKQRGWLRTGWKERRDHEKVWEDDSQGQFLVKFVTIQYKLEQIIKHLAPTTHRLIRKKLEGVRRELIDYQSIKEIPFKNPNYSFDPEELTIINFTDHSQQIWYQGEELVPVRLLPDNGGVECRGRFTCQYRIATPEMFEIAKEYETKLASTKKALRELPVALANNDIALREHINSSELNPEEIGPLTVERARIQKELTEQKAKLKVLESTPLQFDQEKFITHTFQTSIIFRMGSNLLDGKEYHVVPTSTFDRSNPQKATHSLVITSTAPTPKGEEPTSPFHD